MGLKKLYVSNAYKVILGVNQVKKYFMCQMGLKKSHQYSKNPLAYLGNHQAHTQILRKIKPQWQHNPAYHKPLSPSFKPSQKLQELIQDQSSTAVNCMFTKERVSMSFQSNFTFKTDQHTSLSKITAFIVKLLRNSTS